MDNLNELAREKGFKGTILAIEHSLQVWLREKHNIDVLVTREMIGSDDFVYAYEIYYEPGVGKRLFNRLITLRSFVDGPSSYSGGWDTYSEALENGLVRGLNLLP